MTITEAAQSLAPHLSELRREFHRHPEVSGNESQTADSIVSELSAIGGYQITKNVGGHGVLAVLHGALPGKTVALRADMDALQINEETGLPFCSENPGMMHACGHDNHMAMLLGAATLLAERKDKLAGTVRLIFQPAEELSPKGGSRDMIAAGALDGVDAVFGLHV
ncbi:MAG: amidohydrolase, partial [Lawsonibacter sp.]|nr:amidohydrolase [Lawsonibacter sp.]